jgi:transaldolase
MVADASHGSLTTNPTGDLRRQGQAIWLDFIQRSLISSGGLRRLVEEDGLSGVTSNPAIFEKAIDQTDDYQAAIKQTCARNLELTPKQVFEHLAVEDIKDAADVLRPDLRAHSDA